MIEEGEPLHRLRLKQQQYQEKFLQLFAYCLLVYWDSSIHELFVVTHELLRTICVVLNSSVCDLCHLVFS